MKVAPMLSTCSFAAPRTSVALPIAPSRRAVAIAWSPATPAPMTNTRAGGTISLVGEIGPLAGATLDQHREAHAGHVLDCIGRGRDAPFVCAALLDDGDFHRGPVLSGDPCPETAVSVFPWHG